MTVLMEEDRLRVKAKPKGSWSAGAADAAPAARTELARVVKDRGLPVAPGRDHYYDEVAK